MSSIEMKEKKMGKNYTRTHKEHIKNATAETEMECRNCGVTQPSIKIWQC